MDQEELVALLALSQTPQLGDGSIKKLMATFGSATQIMACSKAQLLEVDGIGSAKVKHIGDKEFHAFAKAEVALMNKHGITATAFYEPSYPGLLKHCHDGPVLLFSKGQISWDQQHILSIVGSRKNTAYSKQRLGQFFEEIRPFQPLIVSGFAYGVDINAHLQALEHGLQTVGVLAHGLHHCYPKPHKKYMTSIMAKGGFVSDFCCGDPFVHRNFLRRNRIIAGLSQATIVVESARKGGSLVTADFANGYHRDVFAIPGRIGDRQSEGCNDLIKQHKAHLLSTVDDLAYILNWVISSTAQKEKKIALLASLSEAEQTIYSTLSEEGRQHLDVLAMQCQMPTARAAALLFQLEMKNLVTALPGKQFEAL